MTDKEYAKERMDEASKLMSANTGIGSLYEYHKGQFLAFREILHPEIYGKYATQPDKEEKL